MSGLKRSSLTRRRFSEGNCLATGAADYELRIYSTYTASEEIFARQYKDINHLTILWGSALPGIMAMSPAIIELRSFPNAEVHLALRYLNHLLVRSLMSSRMGASLRFPTCRCAVLYVYVQSVVGGA
jgi:hypothetical protein